MVSVNSSKELLLGDARSMLYRELASLPGKKNLEEAFSAWLLRDSDIPFKLREAACVVAEHVGGQRRYRDVAVLGFAAASNCLQAIHCNALKEGLLWISGREPLLEGRLQGFCTDVVALLGIVLGAQVLEDAVVSAKLSEWLNKFLHYSFQARLTDWQMCLLSAVGQIGRANHQNMVPTTNELADVRAALRSKESLDYDEPNEEQDRLDALLLIKRGCDRDIDINRAALRLAAFEAILLTESAISMSRPTVEDVSRILSRLSAGFRRWTWEEKARTRGGKARKWFIDNEYHVQNFLYFLLAPVFPDLKEEEYTPSVGQIHPRADLGIPSLGLIVEVKFMRTSDSPQKMIEQIAADSSLYLVSGSEYHHILAFIWDDSCRTQEYDYMRSGLMQLRGVIDAVIMARPGNLSKINK